MTETHVLLHLTSGGPYVPTPLVYPHLMVPGDNGKMLFYNAAGELVLEDRVHDHFTSSPVGADGKIYWCSERGKTYVIDAAGLAGDKPAVKLLSVNQLHGALPGNARRSPAAGCSSAPARPCTASPKPERPAWPHPARSCRARSPS